MPELPAMLPGEVRGNAWSALPVKNGFKLSFLSGELAGREISIEITQEEYDGLADGSLSISNVLRNHRVG